MLWNPLVPSDTKFEGSMSAMNDSSEPKPAPETDGTHDEESLCIETDDLDTKTSAPEPPSVLQSVSPSQLPQHRIYGKREGAVVHERSVRPSP